MSDKEIKGRQPEQGDKPKSETLAINALEQTISRLSGVMAWRAGLIGNGTYRARQYRAYRPYRSRA